MKPAERITCTKCGAMILPTTANATGGICMPCRNAQLTPLTSKGDYDPVLQDQFDQLAERIRRKKVAGGKCPRCGLALNVTRSDCLMDIRCPDRCFEFHQHGTPNRIGLFIMRLKRLLGSRRTNSTTAPVNTQKTEAQQDAEVKRGQRRP